MDVYWDDIAIEEMLNSPDGPVWQLVNELSQQAAEVARELVPIRSATSTWSRKSNAQAIGATLASIHEVMGYNAHGRIYGGINAIEIPSIFLEYPRTDRRKQPFLTTAVWSLEGIF
jgi:hypothetical protein